VTLVKIVLATVMSKTPFASSSCWPPPYTLYQIKRIKKKKRKKKRIKDIKRKSI
jgi:hypothetical protein